MAAQHCWDMQGQQGMQRSASWFAHLEGGINVMLLVCSFCFTNKDVPSINTVLPIHCNLTWKKRLGFRDSSLNWSD
jgi:hypothetical protein